MNRLMCALCGAVFSFFSLPAAAGDPAQPPATEARELIYCADLMTSAEREAYRVGMRAARSPQEREALRNAHREMMHTRARERGMDALECVPLRQRQRLRGNK